MTVLSALLAIPRCVPSNAIPLGPQRPSPMEALRHSERAGLGQVAAILTNNLHACARERSRLWALVMLTPRTLGILATLAMAGAGCHRDSGNSASMDVGVFRDDRPSALASFAGADGRTAANASSTGAGPRIYSKARFAWVRPEPRASKGWLGYLGLGGSVRLRGETAKDARFAGSAGCSAWYAVEPRGYICDGDTASIDPNNKVVAQLALDGPRITSAWPYYYAESMGTPRYATLPSQTEQHRAEPDLEAHLARVASARGGTPDASPGAPLVDAPNIDAMAWLPLSPYVREARKAVAAGSTVAYTREPTLRAGRFS